MSLFRIFLMILSGWFNVLNKYTQKINKLKNNIGWRTKLLHIRKKWGKWQKNDKNLLFTSILLKTLVSMSNFMNKKKTKKTLIYQRTYQRFQQYTGNFLDQKKKIIIKGTMIMWDQSFKHFCRFPYFFCIRRVCVTNLCVP